MASHSMRSTLNSIKRLKMEHLTIKVGKSLKDIYYS